MGARGRGAESLAADGRGGVGGGAQLGTGQTCAYPGTAAASAVRLLWGTPLYARACLWSAWITVPALQHVDLFGTPSRTCAPPVPVCSRPLSFSCCLLPPLSRCAARCAVPASTPPAGRAAPGAVPPAAEAEAAEAAGGAAARVEAGGCDRGPLRSAEGKQCGADGCLYRSQAIARSCPVREL